MKSFFELIIIKFKKFIIIWELFILIIISNRKLIKTLNLSYKIKDPCWIRKDTKNQANKESPATAKPASPVYNKPLY